MQVFAYPTAQEKAELLLDFFSILVSEVFSFSGTVFAFADIVFCRSSSHLLRNFDNIVILKTNEIYVIMFKNTIKIIARLLSESINAMWSFITKIGIIKSQKRF